jgi:hypothetical protein
MKLKEKILDQVQEMPLETSPTKKDIDNYNLSINNLEKIAEQFAIGFAEWVYLDGRDILIFKGLKTTKELLEIYKKEKGL